MISINEKTTLGDLIREGISFQLTFTGHPVPVVERTVVERTGVERTGVERTGVERTGVERTAVEPVAEITDAEITEVLKRLQKAKGPEMVLEVVGERIKSVSELSQDRRQIIKKTVEDLINE